MSVNDHFVQPRNVGDTGEPSFVGRAASMQCGAAVRVSIQIDEQLHLVELPEVTVQRGGGALNHSCDSTLWMADEVTLIARRAIAAGEELTVDYALFSGEADAGLEQGCRCGSPVCRHITTGNDWQLPEVQQRYYSHFSPFINARIERLRQEQR